MNTLKNPLSTVQPFPKTPWCSRETDDKDGCIPIDGWSESDGSSTQILRVSQDCITASQQDSNAAFVVMCVNSHETLVSTLEAILTSATSMSKVHNCDEAKTTLTNIAEHARNALLNLDGTRKRAVEDLTIWGRGKSLK